MSYQLKNAAKYYLRDARFYLISSWLRASRRDPKSFVLCNSFPKSGTHLLFQILQKLHDFKIWHNLISSQGWAGLMNSSFHLRYKMASVVDNSLVRGHLYYCPEVLDLIDSYAVTKFFIFRDPRDVAVSYMRYICNEPRGYMHGYLQSLSSDQERLSAVIKGVHFGDAFGLNISLTPVAEECKRYQGWISDPQTLAVRFEDLVGERGGGDENLREQTIINIAKHLGCSSPVLSQFHSMKIDPNKSHTFRKGQIGSWRENFTNEHKDLFKDNGGEVLIDLGYETDMNW